MHRNAVWFFVATILIWKPWPVAGRSVSAYTWEQSTCVAGCTPSRQVAYIAADGDIHELYNIAGTGWADADLTAITGGPPPSAGSPLVGHSWEIANSKSVAYIADDGHIHELYVDTYDQSWYHADLTALALGAPLAAGTPLAGYSFESGGSKQVAYIAADGHIHELYVFWHGDGWHDADLTLLTGSSRPPDISRPLVGFSSEAYGAKQVAYIDTGGVLHVLEADRGSGWHEVPCIPLACPLTGPPHVPPGSPLAGYSWDASSTWLWNLDYLGDGHRLIEVSPVLSSRNLTSVTGSPLPSSASPLAAYGSSRTGLINSAQIVYTTDDGDIHELSFFPNNTWAPADLTFLTGAPQPDGTVLLGYSSEVAGPSKQVVYTTADGHIYELYWAPGGAWTPTDLTGSTGAPPAQ